MIATTIDTYSKERRIANLLNECRQKTARIAQLTDAKREQDHNCATLALKLREQTKRLE